jgi:predicted small lipoprotein YifL
MTILRVLVLLALAAGAAACGQKGPLVLPDAQHPRKKVKFPVAPKTPSTMPDAPAAPSAGPAQSPAPPEAAPETNAVPSPGPQA